MVTEEPGGEAVVGVIALDRDGVSSPTRSWARTVVVAELAGETTLTVVAWCPGNVGVVGLGPHYHLCLHAPGP